MTFTLITTCYNRSHTIQDAIQSVLNQDYPHIEYILIDGASSDNSLSVIQQYHSRIAKIISEPDNGMYEAINKGIRQATGDIIGLLHSDDFLYAPDTISRIAERFQETDCDLVYGNGLFVDATHTHKTVRNWISGDYSKTRIAKGWLPLHPTVYIKKNCLDRVGEYNEHLQIASDSDFLIRCLYKENLNISYLDEYIVKMRMGGLSTSVSKQFRKWKEDLHLYRVHGFNPYRALAGKIITKIPQFFI